MDPQGTERESFWKRRHSPIAIVGIIAAVLAVLPVVLLSLWIGLIFVGCSVSDNCLGG